MVSIPGRLSMVARLITREILALLNISLLQKTHEVRKTYTIPIEGSSYSSRGGARGTAEMCSVQSSEDSAYGGVKIDSCRDYPRRQVFKLPLLF